MRRRATCSGDTAAPRPADAIVAHDTNRGVALFGDKVFYAAGRSRARRARRQDRQRKSGRPPSPTTNRLLHLTSPPLVADGKVMVGARAGSRNPRLRRGVRSGHRQRVVENLHDAGAGRAGQRDVAQAAINGRPAARPMWVTGNYDPDTNLAFWGTGNGGPWIGDQRPGDNLYIASTVAIDVATGQIKGHFQYNAERIVGLGRGVAADPRRLSAQRTHRQRTDQRRARRLPLFSRADAAGKINFVEGKPFVKQNVFKSLDPMTGRPDVDLGAQAGYRQDCAEFCPVVARRQELAARSPSTRRRG